MCWNGWEDEREDEREACREFERDDAVAFILPHRGTLRFITIIAFKPKPKEEQQC